jgi:hypothetical protein
LSSLSFESPLGALVALVVVVPLAGFVAFERREKRVRRNLGLPDPHAWAQAPVLVGLVVLAALLGLAAAQPMLTHATPRKVRLDAQAYAVFDTSNSMSARQEAGPTRLDRSRRLAIQLREALPDVPFGVASFAEITLPHLFPTPNEQAFAATVTESVRIGQPPSPNLLPSTARGTDLAALTALNQDSFFSPSATHRLVVVFSDDESSQFFADQIAAAFRRPLVHVIFVHVWNSQDRIHLQDGRVDPGYTPDPTSLATVNQLASQLDGQVFSEQNLSGIVQRAQADLGSGRVAPLTGTRTSTPLARWLLLLAFLPLAVVLRRGDVGVWSLRFPPAIGRVRPREWRSRFEAGSRRARPEA